MRKVDLTGPPPKDGRKNPDKIFLLVTIGTAEDWGEFEPLRGSTWAHGITVVSGESYSHALHGFFHPLQKELGRDPLASARRVSPKEGECLMREDCINWKPELCRPGGKLKKEVGPPDCYYPPIESSPDDPTVKLLTEVVLAWKESRHTIVVDEQGAFNFR
jgi:hypothetical protein